MESKLSREMDAKFMEFLAIDKFEEKFLNFNLLWNENCDQI
jgi:hypothetical protein